MVYESRVGDVFALGATSWRIEDITHDRVLVTPAPGDARAAAVLEGRHPRPARRARRGGRRVHPRAGRAGPRPRRAPGRRERASTTAPPATWSRYLARAARGHPARARATGTLVVERFRDELGDWRLVVHSPYGMPVHAPWALAINARLRERYGIDGQAMASDDGIVRPHPRHRRRAARRRAVRLRPRRDRATSSPTEVGGSALFASRFRECAARALLLPRRDPGHALAAVAAAPAAAAAARGGAQVPVLPDRARDRPRVPAGRLRPAGAARPDAPRRAPRGRRSSTSPPQQPSPVRPHRCCSATSARSCTRATPRSPSAAPRRSRSTRGCSPSCSAGPSCASCSTPRCSPRSRPSCSASPRTAGPATPRASPTCCGCSARSAPPRSPPAASTGADAAAWLTDAGRRPARGRGPDRRRGALVPRSRTSAGCATGSASRCPPGTPEAFTEPVDDPLGDLVGRYARTHGPFPADEVAARLGLGVAVVRHTLQPAGRRAGGCSRASSGPPGSGAEWCDAEVLRRLRRRSLARLRKEVEPVDPAALGRFLPAWQHVSTRRSRSSLRGVDGVLAVIEQLAGCPVPASALESLVLPARVADYQPAMLDELTASGEVLWAGHGDPARHRRLGRAPPGRPGPADPARPGAASSTPSCTRRCSTRWPPAGPASSASSPTRSGPPTTRPWRGALWDLVWAGRVSNDTFAPLRALTRRRPGHPPHRGARRPAPAPTGPGRARMPSRAGPPDDRRPLVAAARARHRPDPARARDRRAAARPARRGHPRRGGAASASPAASRRSTRCSPRSRSPGAAGAATSSTGWARPSSAPPGRSTGCAPSPRPASSQPEARAHPGRHRPGQPVRRGAALAGRARPPTASRHRSPTRAQGRGRWSCWSTARSALYVERGGTHPAHVDRRRGTLLATAQRPRWPRPPAAAPWAGSPSSRPTASSCSAAGPTPLRRRSQAAGFVATPARAEAAARAEPCLRATPSGAPPAPWTAALTGHVLTGTDFRVPASGHGRPLRRPGARRPSPAASTCSPGSTPGTGAGRCTPT